MSSSPLESLQMDRETVQGEIEEHKHWLSQNEGHVAARCRKLERAEAALVNLDKAIAALGATFPEWVAAKPKQEEAA